MTPPAQTLGMPCYRAMFEVLLPVVLFMWRLPGENRRKIRAERGRA